MATKNLGKVFMTPKGQWDKTLSYTKLDIVTNKIGKITTIAQIEDEANVVIKTLNKRKLDYPVFLDIEDKCQENLSDSLMMKMIEAFRAIIIKAGYKFGIYCGYSWYQYQLPEGAKKYDCWVARYPNNDTGELQERLKVNMDSLLLSTLRRNDISFLRKGLRIMR